jgi:hypothetical protein
MSFQIHQNTSPDIVRNSRACLATTIPTLLRLSYSNKLGVRTPTVASTKNAPQPINSSVTARCLKEGLDGPKIPGPFNAHRFRVEGLGEPAPPGERCLIRRQFHAQSRPRLSDVIHPPAPRSPHVDLSRSPRSQPASTLVDLSAAHRIALRPAFSAGETHVIALGAA